MKEPGLPEHVRHLYEGEPDEDLIEGLEPDQLVDAMESKLPRRRVGGWTEVGLWALRVFVLTMTGLVIYTFAAGLGAHPG
jgi:hypothetical protein